MTIDAGRVTRIRLTDNVADADKLIALRSQDGSERFAAVLRRVMAAIDRGAYDCELSRESTDELERDCNEALDRFDELHRKTEQSWEQSGELGHSDEHVVVAPTPTHHKPAIIAALRRADARVKKIEAAETLQRSVDEHVVVADEALIPTWAWRKAWRGMHGTNYGTQFYDVEIRAREIFDKEKSLTDYIKYRRRRK